MNEEIHNPKREHNQKKKKRNPKIQPKKKTIRIRSNLTPEDLRNATPIIQQYSKQIVTKQNQTSRTKRESKSHTVKSRETQNTAISILPQEPIGINSVSDDGKRLYPELLPYQLHRSPSLYLFLCRVYVWFS